MIAEVTKGPKQIQARQGVLAYNYHILAPYALLIKQPWYKAKYEARELIERTPKHATARSVLSRVRGAMVVGGRRSWNHEYSGLAAARPQLSSHLSEPGFPKRSKGSSRNR
jgi:hypothetical protein